MSIIQLIEKYQKIIIFSCLVFAGIAFFDKALAVGFLLLSFLVSLTFLMIAKSSGHSRNLGILFLVVIFVHLIAALFIYYFHFYPFGGGEGDQFYYNQTAVELAARFHSGNFSIQGYDSMYPYYYVSQVYPVVVAVLYAVALPSVIIGQILNVWIVALSILLLYLIVIEIGGSGKAAFLVGLIACIYPSYLYFGSLLIRDAIVAFLSLLCLLLIIKLTKKISIKNILLFCLAAGLLVHFRFYVGLIMIGVFLFSWFVFFPIQAKKKIVCGALILVLFSLLPMLFGQGLFGENYFKKFLNTQAITFLREGTGAASSVAPNINFNSGSTVVIKTGFDNPVTFIGNSLQSFLSVALGPFPWQVRLARQLFSLPEVIAWWFLVFLIIRGVFRYEGKYRLIIPLILFALLFFAVSSVFIDNFGTYMRIRIPAFLTLFALADLNFLEKGFVGKIIKGATSATN
jgi:hypothetical protein